MRRQTTETSKKNKRTTWLALFMVAALSVSALAEEPTVDVSNTDISNLVGGTSGGGEPEVSQQPAYDSVISRYYEPTQESMTAKKLQDARNDKASAERGLTQANDDLEELETESDDVKTYLIQVDSKLQQANKKLLEYEELVEEKERSIENADKQLKETREAQEKRMKNMRGRIKYMYEQGSESYIDILLTSRSFSDFLNKAAYFESINQYDRKMLKEYSKTQVKVGEQEAELIEQKETLEVLREECREKTAEVYQEVIAASASLSQYTEEIAEKEAQALAYEQEIADKEDDIALLQEQYKKELALSMESASMGSRDLSDVVFGNGDLDLMAAIIECEAGGESYTGKVAVGAVVLNRVRSPKFPNTVLEVLMAPRQFSPVGSGRFSMVLARGANASCYQAAADAMAGASPVGNCLFFRTPIPGLVGQQIGGHIFY